MSLWEIGLIAAFVFLILEIALPATIFLGFAIGAVAVAACAWLGEFSVSVFVVLFAVVSAASWLVLRMLFRGPGDSRSSDGDINRY